MIPRFCFDNFSSFSVGGAFLTSELRLHRGAASLLGTALLRAKRPVTAAVGAGGRRRGTATLGNGETARVGTEIGEVGGNKRGAGEFVKFGRFFDDDDDDDQLEECFLLPGAVLHRLLRVVQAVDPGCVVPPAHQCCVVPPSTRGSSAAAQAARCSFDPADPVVQHGHPVHRQSA